MAGDDVSIRIGADTAGLTSALSSAKSSISSFQGEVQTSMGGLSSVFSTLTTQFASLGALLGGGTILGALTAVGAAINKFGGQAAELSTMASTLGVTTDQMQAMNAVADETSVSQEVVARGVERLTNSLNDARDGSGSAITNLKRLGVTNEELASPTFTIVGLLQVLHARMNDANTAASTQAELLKELGTRGAQFAEWVKAADLSEQGVAGTMSKVNGILTDQVAGLKETFAQWKAFGTTVENALAKALVKVTQFYEYVKENSGAVKALTAVSQALGTLPSGEAGGSSSSGPAGRESATAAANMQIALSREVTDAVIRDDREQVASTQAGTAERVAAAKKLYEDLRTYYAGTTEKAEQAAAHSALLADEREYQAKRIEAQRQATEAIKASTVAALEEARRAMEDSKATLAEMTDDVKDSARQQLDAQVGAIERGIAMIHEAAAEHRLSAATELADVRTMLEAELAAWRSYFGQIRGLDTAAGASAKTADEQLAAEHQKILSQMQTADDKYHKDEAAKWKQFGDQIANSLDGVLNGMLAHNKTFAQSMKSLFASMGESVISTLTKVAMQALVNAAISKEAGQSAAKSNILANAAQAASGAMASAAAIPYIGWILAPIEGAAVYAAALAFPMAEGGFDVPAGINPLTQLHSQEMVLPAKYADVIRGMAGGGGSGGGDVHHHHHYGSSMDAKSFFDYVHTPAARDAIVSTLKRARGRGNLR